MELESGGVTFRAHGRVPSSRNSGAIWWERAAAEVEREVAGDIKRLQSADSGHSALAPTFAETGRERSAPLQPVRRGDTWTWLFILRIEHMLVVPEPQT